VKGLGLDWLGTAGTKPAAGISPEPRTNQVVGQRVAVAQQELERAGVTVAAVEPYDPAKGGTNLLSFARTGGRIPRGQPVTLFEKDGVVKYYTVGAAPAPEVADLRRGLEATRTDVESAREELTSLRVELSEARRASGEALASREAEIASLRSSTERMAVELADLRGLRTEVDRLRGERPR
jgi:DNA repair exonuclease SbcCD ATPase subunit